jgi:hypothetical protein
MRKFGLLAAGIIAAAAISISQPAAATTVLTFEGVGNTASVNNFYNGGTDSAGHSGTNYGIAFSSNSLGLIDFDAGGTGNFGNEPSPNTILFFLSGGAATMNVAAGFDTGFSFFYSGDLAGTVNVYSGLNGTGDLLASLVLAANAGNCSGDPNGTPYCNWTNFGVLFSGTAHSVDFSGTADRIGFDNITLGSNVAGGAVPEPGTWAMMLLGFGAIGVAFRRRRARRLQLA